MIRVEEASEIVGTHAHLISQEDCAIDRICGRVLREGIYADRDFPPFDRVAMDGIAIQFSAFQEGLRLFSIEGQVPAGKQPIALQHRQGCLEVATGAVLPEGTDTVVPYEQIQIEAGIAEIKIESVGFRQNIHHRGSDQKNGTALLEPGRLLGPAELAILATVGKTSVSVSRSLRIAFVATGDELVNIEATPLPWQIRMSNAYALKSLLETHPVDVDTFHCLDDFNVIKNLVKKILEEYDVLILSGGVSAGKRDFIPEVLQTSGVEILFHKVTQRPGKPLLFGQVPSGAAVFALPGNPVSAFMCTCKYLIPWIEKSLGLERQLQEWAFLQESLEFKPDLTWFVPVRIENQLGVLRAFPKPGHGSGDLANLEAADGFLELPRGRDFYSTEEPFRLIRYRK
ncbi:MAG: molybdopterin molybdotransferase MoeA [Lewinellaceae bacterium]|nr:molybdopterin molybdotransferase MoeA [Saprospiraceae bacterium]MCB9330427.1 molybdopterin molybdotransferase MoeA [Lewinellaceae bacterium]